MNATFKVPTPSNEPVKSYAPKSPEKLSLKEELQRQRKNPIEITPVINGKKIESRETHNVTSPHNKSLILAKCHEASRDDILQAANSATKNQREWAAMPWASRAAVFLKAADLIATKYRDRLNAATMLGQSKTVYQAEIDSACEIIDFLRFNVAFMEQIYAEQPISSPGVWNRLVARGLEGFVFAVTPFNFTAIGLNLPTAPAMMGCSVIWKPATTAALSAHVGLEILHEAGLPPGVIQFIPGDARMISETLLSHRDFSGLHFTGSTGTFDHLWQQIAGNLSKYKNYPRICGETGGKDFVFLHPSADVETASVALVRGSFEYQGQKCSAASRAYVPKSLWPQVKERLVDQIKTIKMGDVEDFTNFMGAVIDKKAYDRIKGYIDRARSSSDAKILIGGKCDESVGYFIEPTVIEASKPDYESMREEIFGPVLSIFVYDDQKLDEAIALCEGGSDYALTGAIFARDRRVIEDLSNRFENAAGNFYINDKPTGAVVGQQPFGGGRKSGTNDKAGSVYNLMRWVSHRTIKETFVAPTQYGYPFMGEK